MRIVVACLALLGPVRARAGDHDRGPAVASTYRSAGVLADSIKYSVLITDNNLMGVTVTNYGFIGSNFVGPSPSMEYPLGGRHEHLVRGGLWFGAHAVDDSGAFVGVVTGALDGREGSSAQEATEFTPAGRSIQIRSTLPNNKFYSRQAVSEQDYLTDFSDRPAKRSANNQEGHRPMSILVHQENYAWSFSDYQHLIIYHFVVKNQGPPLADAWFGLYAEMASGDKNTYTNWPPGGTWYNKKWLQYDDSLRLIREHYCNGLPIPGGCFLERVPEWVGFKLLGTRPEPITTKQVTLGAWRWTPDNAVRDEDVERYAIMSAGTIQDLSASDLLPQSGDPVAMLAVGPFSQINPGDSVVVDYAIVGGEGLSDASKIQEHARFAQRAFDRNYVVPVPPPSPRLKVVARSQSLDLYWDSFPETVADTTGPYPMDFEGFRIYVGEDRNQLNRIAQFDLATPPNDTTGFNTGLNAVRRDTTIDGLSYNYRYTIPALRNGFKYFVAVTAYDLGNTEIESLESGIAQNKTLAIPNPAAGEKPANKVYVYPNPYRVEAAWDRGKQVRDHYLWFTNLPPHCKVRIYTLSGDLIYETEFVGTSYQGGGTRGVYDPARELDVGPPTLSGTSLAWNLITRQGQAAATGLYMFSVENLNGGDKTIGKFLIVKSDREGFQ